MNHASLETDAERAATALRDKYGDEAKAVVADLLAFTPTAQREVRHFLTLIAARL